MSVPARQIESHLTSQEQVKLYEIAHQMKKAKLPDKFIADAINTAFFYEGVADLLKLWSEETDLMEKEEIIADIHELVDDCAISKTQRVSYIQMNDLDAIAKDIRNFKDNLLTIVNEYGGITKLSELTHIPQPSLSRFFNSNAMPHRTTLLKIATALKLDAVKIATPWTK